MHLPYMGVAIFFAATVCMLPYTRTACTLRVKDMIHIESYIDKLMGIRVRNRGDLYRRPYTRGGQGGQQLRVVYRDGLHPAMSAPAITCPDSLLVSSDDVVDLGLRT